MKFLVKVSREWKEYGTVTIEADSADDARDVAMEMLVDGDDEIEWESENMEPGQDWVEDIEEMEQ